ncbi:type 1 glutamine amidotransferase [Geomonas sp. RF6]|uniref:type 1 glutamine amidotransferase n=1 Tax=Geomonas sp. RF6 TaxID=2897342 RepID=UPI001E515922|nr:type 1 glutamine amidotransferase [Geomonas sp. RF6]UFS69948.1 type 1 glutamine amidotransferase [Geomonas sp. RF6]
MRAHFLQHVPFEGLGYIGTWLEGAGAQVTGTRFFAGEPLPELEGIDLVVAMGGPMSVNDEAAFPWLAAEKAFVREAVERGTAVLGVCLGAQLIASSLGAAVYRNAQREIGWFPVSATPSAGAFRFPEEAVVLHWHGETFDLPPGAVLLARSAGCEHQAFQIGERVIGLQFHLEMTPEAVESITEHCRDELVPDVYVQSEEQLKEASPERYAAGHAMMGEILSCLTRGR